MMNIKVILDLFSFSVIILGNKEIIGIFRAKEEKNVYSTPLPFFIK